MRRRDFLKAAAAGSGLTLLGSLPLTARASAAPVGPYGPLNPPDRNGIRLPSGFRSAVIAVTASVVGETGYRWHQKPDGGATFAQPDGGWIYVSNDESNEGRGGVSMVRFDAAGRIADAGSILQGTSRNCAGGPTPWGTWLSCEEFDEGRVWECDPRRERPAEVRPAMGVFSHEAAAVDPVDRVVYLTEDKPEGGLYRFVPTRDFDLAEGELQVLAGVEGSLEWIQVPDPAARSAPTRDQVGSYLRFAGGEGAWFDGSVLYFTTKGDNRVWRFDPKQMGLDVIYDIGTSSDPILRGVDNITVSASGDLFICEDGGDMEIVLLDRTGAVSPFLRLAENSSELTGVAFDPSGTRMYFSSQRNPGVTYEVSGPFRAPTTVAETPSGVTEPEPRRASVGDRAKREQGAAASQSGDAIR